MRSLLLRLGLMGLVLAFAFGLVPSVVSAVDAINARPDTAAARENAQTRLTDARKRACENRQQNIKNLMARITTRAENHLALFTTIAERVQAYYEAQGSELANYNELASALESAKTDADAGVAALKASATFSCDSDDPKGEISAFQAAHRTVLQDLHDYRTAVKNLIVGIRSAQAGGGES